MEASTLRIATLNMLHTDELIIERFKLILKEAQEKTVGTILLQEVPYGRKREFQEIASNLKWHFKYVRNVKLIDGIAILSREKPIESKRTNLLSCYDSFRNVAHHPLLEARFANHIVLSAHFPWGERDEQARLETAFRVSTRAEELKQKYDLSIFLGGDLNATPDSSTVRFLKGLESYKNQSFHWTDSWMTTEAIFATARTDGGWAEDTALRHGIVRPDLMPNRTIDYLMSYGWNFGKNGSPLNLERFGELTLPDGRGVSDHYGIIVDFLLL